MAATKKFKVSFVIKSPNVTVEEHLRYMGVVSVWSDTHGVPPPLDVARYLERQPSEAVVTVTYPGFGKGDVWQEMQLGRLRSFGVRCTGWRE